MIQEQKKRPGLEAGIRPEQGQLLDQRNAEPESATGRVSSIGPARILENSWVLAGAEPPGET